MEVFWNNVVHDSLGRFNDMSSKNRSFHEAKLAGAVDIDGDTLLISKFPYQFFNR
jgi:hypothetical protein